MIIKEFLIVGLPLGAVIGIVIGVISIVLVVTMLIIVGTAMFNSHREKGKQL